jgi:lactate dehydrogenase-like 2-hydroxyacid dehydrogenase
MATADSVITVTRRLPRSIERRLEDAHGTVLNGDDHRFTDDELRRALASSDVLLCTLGDRLPRELLSAPDRRTRLLANFGAGVDHIDLGAARDHGVVVTNTPGVLTGDTADLALLLMLAVARRAGEGERELRAGDWSGWRPTHLLGTRVHGATLGIVGFGRIGQAVARRAHHGFGMPLLYYSRRTADREISEETGAVRCDSLAELLGACDFVSLHCPSTSATHHLMGAEQFRLMRSTAFLVNTARGEVVDENALIAALAEGQIAGAALDVYEHEPHVPADLLSLPNVVTLPHLGSATQSARVAMGERALANIEAWFRGEPPPDRIA